MAILTSLLKGIKDRQLDEYFELEEDLSKLSKIQVLEVLNDKNKGSDPVDKLRLFIQWFLSTEQDVPKGEIDKFETALRNAGADVTSISYIRQSVASCKPRIGRASANASVELES
jgi:hypothetical protein